MTGKKEYSIKICKNFPEFLWRFGIFSYLCSAYKTVVVHSSGRTSDAQLVKPGIFYAIRVVTRNIHLRLHSRKTELPSGESLFCKQRELQPFLCLLASGVRWHAYKTVRYATVNFSVRWVCRPGSAANDAGHGETVQVFQVLSSS